MRVAARITLDPFGAVARTRLLPSSPMPAGASACLEQRLSTWRFEALAIRREVELLVSFTLAR